MFWYKKAVMPNEKVIAARNLKKIVPNLQLKTMEKKKIKVFIAIILCFPDKALRQN